MKYVVKFYNPEQTFTIKANNYEEILKDFEEINKGFIVKNIKEYGHIVKCDVYDSDNNFVDKIKITR